LLIFKSTVNLELFFTKFYMNFKKDQQFYKFCAYGFLKNLRFFEPFLILFLLDEGLSFLEIGLLYSFREIVKNIFEIPAGIIADITGRKNCMLLSFSFYMLSFVGYYFSNSFGWFSVSIMIFGLGDTFRTGTHKAMIYDYLSFRGWTDYKVQYYGYTRSWSQLGSALSALIATAIVIFTKNYRAIFIFSIIPYLLDFINLASYPRFLNGEQMLFKNNYLMFKFKSKSIIKEFIQSFKNKNNLKAILSSSSYGAYYGILKDLLQPVLKTLALAIPVFISLKPEQRSAIVIGATYFIIYILTSIASRNSSRISSRFKTMAKPVNISLLLGLGFGLIAGLLYNQKLLLISVICYLIVLIIENIRKPVNMAYIATVNKKEVLTSVLSVESQFKAIFIMVLGPALGILADKYGLGIGIALISIFLLILFPLFKLKSLIKKTA